MSRALAFGLMLIALPAQGEEVVDRNLGRYSLAFAIGALDTDTSDPDDPHLNELAYSVVLDADVSRFIGIDAELMHLETDRGFDDFGNLSSFGGQGLGVSVRWQWPLAEDFSLYARTGVARFELADDSVFQDLELDKSASQPMYGLGMRGPHWFVEYVNYGKIDALYVEQLRGGLMIRF